MLKALRDLIAGYDDATEVLLTPEPKEVSEAVRVLSFGRAIEVILGKKKLRLYPESPIRPLSNVQSKDWLLVDPEHLTSEVFGFVRLECGERLLIGQSNEDLQAILELPKSVRQRHLELMNDDGKIVIKPLANDGDTWLCSVPDNEGVDWLLAQRVKNLIKLRQIFGGPIKMLEPESATKALESVHTLLLHEDYRPRDSNNLPGGILDLPEGPTPIIVGDIHAQIDNLLKILSMDAYLDALERDKAYLLFLGDTVHREGDDELEEMESSLLILDLIFKLKIHFPKNVFYLRGNHESFEGEVGKGGVPQGRLLWEQCRKARGKRYAKRLADCFDLLPYLARSKDFIACHGGPPRRETSLKKLIDIHKHPTLARELVWNRLRRTGRPDGYSKRDVKTLRAAVGVGKNTPFIVSHTPLSQTGTVWKNAGDVPGHHIMFSANPNKLAVFIRSGHTMVPLEYTSEPLLDFTNGLEVG
jgi:hypothetical protein